MTRSASFRLMLIATALCLSLAACSHGRPVSQDQMKRIIEEMKGPDVPSIDTALIDSAEQAEKSRNYANAAQFYNQLAEKNPKQAVYTLKSADNLRKAGAYDEAVAQYTKLLENEEFKLDAMEGIGLTRMAQGEFEEAGDMLADVMEKDGTRWRTINAIGILFTVKQMYPEARQYFSEAIAQSARNASVHNNMGLMEALDRQYDEAVRLLKEASRYAGKDDPMRKQVELNLALVYAIKGDLDMAEKTARPHLSEAQLLNNMGYYAHLANDDVMAKSYLNMALTASDKHYEKAWKNLETLNKLVNSAPRR